MKVPLQGKTIYYSTFFVPSLALVSGFESGRHNNISEAPRKTYICRHIQSSVVYKLNRKFRVFTYQLNISFFNMFQLRLIYGKKQKIYLFLFDGIKLLLAPHNHWHWFQSLWSISYASLMRGNLYDQAYPISITKCELYVTCIHICTLSVSHKCGSKCNLTA